jgi:glycosyltransferase involved in cell wall biosynthesis
MRVDIGIPTYRRRRGLERAIESAVRERDDGNNVRIFVANNDPEDGLAGVASRYGIEVFTHPVNLGPTGNWNKVIELAHAPYLVILHDDDMLLPGRIQRGLDALERSPHAGMAFCAVEITDSHDNVTRPYKPFATARTFTGVEGARELLDHYMPVRAPGVMFRLEQLRAAGGYDVGSAELGDIELYLTLVLRGAAVYEQHLGARYRFDMGNLTHGIMFRPRDLDLFGLVRSALAVECEANGHAGTCLDDELDQMAARHAVLSALYRLKVDDPTTARACLDPIVRGDLPGAGKFRTAARLLRTASGLPIANKLYDVLRTMQKAKRALEVRR